jgi:Spy/CpxP family protein refolding chaperone
MKKLTYLFALILAFSFAKAQETPKPDFRTMSPEQRREFIQKMTPEQRHQLMEDAAVMMAIKKLEVPAEKQEAFKKLLIEYTQSQKNIKNKFKADFSKENISDSEAKKLLTQSFQLGQELLDNRKIYADKFLKILTPQQVLKLFNHEGKMREKFMERREKMEPPKGGGPMLQHDFNH